MENEEPLGPRPTDPPIPAGFSRSRTSVLKVLRAQRGPTPLATLVDLTGLHENTLRGHLDALSRAGLADRERAAPAGRGRPAWLWRASVADDPEYAGLAATLASSLSRTTPDPARAATEAGEQWGHELAERHGPAAEGSPGDARRDVVRLLDVLGFAPEQDHDGRVRLTRCPLLDAAQRHPDVVCRVHEGLIEGALRSYADDTTTPGLHPFAEPGACTLDLRREER